MDVTFKKPGTYYLKLKAERNDGVGNNIIVSVVQSRGSHLPFLVLGIATLIAGAVWFYFALSRSNKAYARGDVNNDEPKKKSYSTMLIVGLVILFVLAFIYSARGYGYMGYYGYYHGPSFFYWGGPRVSYDRSNRESSISGSGQRGGGFSGGK